MSNHTENKKGVYIIGFILLAAGVFLLLSNLDLIDYSFHDIFFSWEIVLIAIGLIIFITSWDTSGLILIAIGSVFLLADYYNFNPWSFWPVILIIIGLQLLFKSKRHQYKEYKIKDKHGKKWVERHENIIDHNAAFSDIKEMYFANNFQGGKISAVFSGVQIDLTNSKLADGENILDLSVVLAGVSLVIPREWKVIVQTSQVLGGFDDQRKSSVTLDDGKTLIIKGSLVLGGCELKSY